MPYYGGSEKKVRGYFLPQIRRLAQKKSANLRQKN